MIKETNELEHINKYKTWIKAKEMYDPSQKETSIQFIHFQQESSIQDKIYDFLKEEAE